MINIPLESRRSVHRCGLVLLAALAAGTSPAAWNANTLELSAPIKSWDEAVPLGNGLMGGLLWGGENVIRLSLDRGDLWDERPHHEPGWWKNRPWHKGGDWDGPYNGVTPTKLPAGRLQITLAPRQRIESFSLRLDTAEGVANLAGGGAAIQVYYSATQPVVMMRIPGPEPVAFELIPSGASPQGGAVGPSSGGAVAKLGYASAKHGTEGQARWYVQDAADGFQYCACLETRREGDATLVALTVTSTNDGPDVLALARERCAKALAAGYDALFVPHAAWWREFWGQSDLTVPEAPIDNYYQLCRYYYGAASRRGAPPMPLQGVWTADNGGLPPWKGDYHNDLNTQMTYIAYHAAGNFNEGACYLDFLIQLTPAFTEFARDFYGTPGLSSPGVMSLAGQPLGGWGQYSLSPTMTSWNAHLFYLHWRYTMDEAFLRDQAYPWCAAAGECVRALLKPDPEGRLKLFRSSSPEIFNNSARAWLPPNSNYDLMSMKMQFLALVEMADALGKAGDAGRWQAVVDGLEDFHTAEDGTLLLAANTPLPHSHRHLSNIIGIFPFNLIHIEGGDRDVRRIRASLAQWDRLGTSQWCGYSFAWMSGLKARVGDAEGALRNLDIFVKAFILRNGFHVNGDQTRSGFSNFTYRPFTLEGNFAAMQAVHEMLLQSWSPTPGRRDTEVLRLFPATPWRWHDASFTDLRAEGGHRVSARRRNNATEWFRVVAGRDGVLRIRDNFGGRPVRWTGGTPEKHGNDFQFTLAKGAVIEGALDVPATPPPPPADLARPVAGASASGIKTNPLPLRIGAASDGSNRFTGDIAMITVAGKALPEALIADLANPKLLSGLIPKPVDTAGKPEVLADLAGGAFHLDGAGFLELPAAVAPDGAEGLTLAAWIRPEAFPASGMRIIDKCPTTSAQGYLLDTYPGDSLRLITREAHFIHPAKLPANVWTHVAATVDGQTGRQTLFINGQPVKTE